MPDIDLENIERGSKYKGTALSTYETTIKGTKDDSGTFAKGFLNFTVSRRNTEFLAATIADPVSDLGINYDIYKEKLMAKVGEPGGVTKYRTRRYKDKESILEDADKLYKEKVLEYMAYNFGPTKSRELAEKAMRNYLTNELALLDTLYPPEIVDNGIKEVVKDALKGAQT